MSTDAEIWGILLPRIMSRLISSRFQDACEVIRCCFVAVKCSVSSRSRGPNLKQSGNGIPVINQEPDFGLNFWAIGWELFKTVQNPLHKWSRLPQSMRNFHNFWMNVEKSFPEQTWFFQILVLVVFWVVARISDFWDGS